MTSLWLIPSSTPGFPTAQLVDNLGKTVLTWKDDDWFRARTRRDNFILNEELTSLHFRLHDFALRHGLMSEEQEGKVWVCRALSDFPVVTCERYINEGESNS